MAIKQNIIVSVEYEKHVFLGSQIWCIVFAHRNRLNRLMVLRLLVEYTACTCPGPRVYAY